MRHKYFLVSICKVFKQKLKPFVGFFANLGGVAWRHVPISDENNTEMGSPAGIKKTTRALKGFTAIYSVWQYFAEIVREFLVFGYFCLL